MKINWTKYTIDEDSEISDVHNMFQRDIYCIESTTEPGIYYHLGRNI